MFDFMPFETEIFPAWKSQFRLSQEIGDYTWKQGGKRSLYASADMVFFDYILNTFELSSQQAKEWANIINQFQHPTSGWFSKRYDRRHFKEHTTAYAVAALNLLNQTPQHQIPFLNWVLSSKKHTHQWLRRNVWSVIWLASHVISGVPALILMLKGHNFKFFSWYFDWLDSHVDPKSGFWARGFLHKIKLIRAPTKHEMAGAFHMFFIYEYLNRSWQYPKKVIDHTLRLQNPNGLWGHQIPFGVDMDAIYCLLKSQILEPNYRKHEIQDAIQLYLKTAVKLYNDREFVFRNYPTTHRLVGAVNTLALCQEYHPELVKTTKPWQFSLNAVPYI